MAKLKEEWLPVGIESSAIPVVLVNVSMTHGKIERRMDSCWNRELYDIQFRCISPWDFIIRIANH